MTKKLIIKEWRMNYEKKKSEVKTASNQRRKY